MKLAHASISEDSGNRFSEILSNFVLKHLYFTSEKVVRQSLILKVLHKFLSQLNHVGKQNNFLKLSHDSPMDS